MTFGDDPLGEVRTWRAWIRNRGRIVSCSDTLTEFVSKQILYALYHTDDVSTFRLNRFQGPCESPTAARAKGIIVPRVLVVDDDPMVCVAIEVCM